MNARCRERKTKERESLMCSLVFLLSENFLENTSRTNRKFYISDSSCRTWFLRINSNGLKHSEKFVRDMSNKF
ncbi:hypothetical protein B9Z55_024616 [Caenorhabditis nigoni]|nr:hypothetical protein B9Z55_024616 [Caenorhabditis nigoni]